MTVKEIERLSMGKPYLCEHIGRIRMKLILLAGTVFLGLSVSGSTARAVPFDFTYSGSLVTFTVPTTDTYQILAFGAQGGNGALGGTGGGLGAEIGGDFSLAAGEVLQIAVGGAGMPSPGGPLPPSGGGGGGSFVVGPSNTPLVIAGGGGGVGFVDFFGIQPGGGGLTGPDGGGQGGGTGGNGGAGSSSPGGGGGGGGGFSSPGGNDFFSNAGGGGAFPGLAGGFGSPSGASVAAGAVCREARAAAAVVAATAAAEVVPAASPVMVPAAVGLLRRGHRPDPGRGFPDRQRRGRGHRSRCTRARIHRSCSASRSLGSPRCDGVTAGDPTDSCAHRETRGSSAKPLSLSDLFLSGLPKATSCAPSAA